MPRWIQTVIVLAAVKTFVGLTQLIVFLDPSDPFWDRNLFRIVHVLLFTGAATLLLWASRRSIRATYLGAVFLVTASSSASAGFIHPGAASVGILADFSEIVAYLNPDAFLPLLFWMFFREFPRSRIEKTSGNGVADFAINISAIAGFILFVLAAIAQSGRPEWLVAGFPLFFWSILAVLILPAIVFANWRVSKAPVDERRRLRLFMAGLTIGAGPVLLAFLVGAISPGFRSVLIDPHDRFGVSIALRTLPLLIPMLTTYAILVQDVLDLRLVVRKAIRYALARYSVLAATAVPFMLAAAFVFQHSHQPMTELMTGGRLPVLLFLTCLGVALMVGRRSILRGIDRRFFREQYDAYRILHDVVEKSRAVTSQRELAALLCDQTDRALHLERVAALFTDSRRRFLSSPEPGVRNLASSSLLAVMLEGSSDCLDVDLENPRSPLRRLPENDRQWLVDGGFRLLTPMISSAGKLLGVLALGEKRSELGFSREDCALLGSAAASAAGVLERLRARQSPSGGGGGPSGDPTVSEQPAGECIICGAVFPRADTSCFSCGTGLRPALIPLRPFGKYQIKRRLGAGGMGVVYLARDIELGRDVAIKTLPKVSPERSIRLRREARAMAAMTHPNAALIFAVEFFRGVPLLVLEYLPLGTVRDRLRSSPYDLDEVLELGQCLASALEAAHALGILHRDIKPSNVGYSERGVPKLLDFGLARIMSVLQPADGWKTAGSATTLTDTRQSRTETLLTAGVAGTPGYLAPEAILGRRPGPAFDLWSLSVLLFEALSGTNPFQGSTPEETRRLVVDHRKPSIAEFVDGCSPAVVDFFDRCLDRDPGMRPKTARDFRLEIGCLKASPGL